MNGNLPAVAKAMILASLPLCALLAACGGGSDDVFDGVSDKNLTASGIEIVDEQPDASAVTYTSDEALEQVNNLTDGAEVLDSRLLRVVLDQPPPEREHIVWAVRVDPDTLLPYSGGSIEPRFVLASTDIDIVILFIDAQTGQNVASFQGKSGDSQVADPGPTQVSTDALLSGFRQQLDEAHIMILDSAPDEVPALSLSEASEILNDHGVHVTRGALLRVDSYIDTLYLDPATYHEVLAWALEMDLTSYDGEGIFAPQSTVAIVFVGAHDGSFVSMWER